MAKRETKAELQARLMLHYAETAAVIRQEAYNDGKLAAEARYKKEIADARESLRLKILNATGQCLQANAQAQESLARLIDNLGVRL